MLMRPDDVWVECRWRERLLRRSMSVMRCSRTKSCRSGSRTPISAALSPACSVFDSSSSIAPRAASDGLLTGNGHCHFCDDVTWRVGDGGFHRGILFILLFKETKILTALSSPYQNITCRRSPIPIAGAHMLEVKRGVPKATATSVEHEGAGRHLIHQLWYFLSRPSSATNT